MQQNDYLRGTANAVTRYFNKATLPTQQATLGRIAVEILSEGRNLNRKAICTRLLSRLEQATSPEEESHYHELIGMLFDR